jgi:hypothetical protein
MIDYFNLIFKFTIKLIPESFCAVVWSLTNGFDISLLTINEWHHSSWPLVGYQTAAYALADVDLRKG